MELGREVAVRWQGRGAMGGDGRRPELRGGARRNLVMRRLRITPIDLECDDLVENLTRQNIQA